MANKHDFTSRIANCFALLLVALGCFSVSTAAHAVIAAPSVQYWNIYTGTTQNLPGTSAAGVCASVGGSWSGTSCAPWFSIPSYTHSAYSCSAVANSTLSGSNCNCNTGFSEYNGTCRSNWKNSLDALNQSGATLQYTGSSHTVTACHEGFAVTGSGSVLGVKAGVGFGEIYGPYTGTGAACGAAPAGAAAPTPCKPGEFTGTVNGQPVCVPPTSSQTAPQVSTAPLSGASGSQASGIQGAPPGATTSSGTTTCDAGSCTTTTTYRDGGGAVVGTATKQETQPAFCAANPAASICAPEKSECEKDPSTAGCAELDTPSTSGIPGRTVSVGFTAETPFASEGQCPANAGITSTVLGQSLTVWDWTKLCDYALPLRALVMALATFAAFLIVLPVQVQT